MAAGVRVATFYELPGILRELLQRILHRAGYNLLVAEDGKKALEIADQHKGKIDVLLSNVEIGRAHV